ncbi:MAG: tRNA lysidine(34) synthetase TilS [Actinomycetota bacterium]
MDRPDGVGAGRRLLSGSVADQLLGPLLARCTFPPPGSSVTCAVSGGPDSTALLVLAVAAGCRVTVVHVDHGLRTGSEVEVDVVRSAATRLGGDIEVVAARAPVDPGPNLEARARAARYAALPEDVLTGHTMDDQAETVLLALLRGAGLDGLAGMRPDRRPLLGLRRSETVALCEGLGLTVVDDPTNADPTHRRNRVRHEVLPLLDDVADRDVARLLARQAELLRAEADHLDELAAEVDPTDVAAVRSLPLPVARRALRRWLRTGPPPSSADVARVLDVVHGRCRATEVGGRRVTRSDGRLRIEGSETDGPRC